MSDHQTEKDPLSGVETTGHDWDGLKELNNPAPRWWLWVFLICIVWAVGYWFVYPAWPVAGGATKGAEGWTEYRQLAKSQNEILQRRAQYAARFHGTSLDQIRNDPDLYEFARAGGAAAFKENCAACHGTGAAGGQGYPNLNDDDWLWGGTLADIEHTIRVGINSGHADARGTQMPAFGRDKLLTQAQISDVADYVIGLQRGPDAKLDDAQTRGREIFAQNCVACHGASGEGSHELGAPRLNDKIWLYGGSKKDVVNTVTNAHLGVMPTWESRLPEDTIKALAVYVFSLGGGEEGAAAPAAPAPAAHE